MSSPLNIICYAVGKKGRMETYNFQTITHNILAVYFIFWENSHISNQLLKTL